MPPDLHVNQVAESETASGRMFVAIEPLRDGGGELRMRNESLASAGDFVTRFLNVFTEQYLIANTTIVSYAGRKGG